MGHGSLTASRATKRRAWMRVVLDSNNLLSAHMGTPDAGEDYTTLAKTFPAPPASSGIIFNGDGGRMSEAAFLRDFAGGLPEAGGPN